MKTAWTDRNKIVANLFNPAFCGEILRAVIKEYNKHTSVDFPFAFSFIVLPILLHKETRQKMPRSTRTYFFVWVEENDSLFFDFAQRTKSMVKFTKEAISFLLVYKKIVIADTGRMTSTSEKIKQVSDEDYEEYNDILKKAEMLGKWLSQTSDVKSIYSFFRITP
ncbi:MAG TPA: three component ABC system middle component [Pedobacter sp.]|uniref:three component ABC system middle component n=1 Tax=Pedobacter sp. TaxID=1411316 RepID=UPI002C5C6824|nr:three component ABC system middle component [Pedobacter sp.]HMI02395.1 three component ABC system middle component [Pedobacter sp.]